MPMKGLQAASIQLLRPKSTAIAFHITLLTRIWLIAHIDNKTPFTSGL
jgi:hypothetical protein